MAAAPAPPAHPHPNPLVRPRHAAKKRLAADAPVAMVNSSETSAAAARSRLCYLGGDDHEVTTRDRGVEEAHRPPQGEAPRGNKQQLGPSRPRQGLQGKRPLEKKRSPPTASEGRHDKTCDSRCSAIIPRPRRRRRPWPTPAGIR